MFSSYENPRFTIISNDESRVLKLSVAFWLSFVSRNLSVLEIFYCGKCRLFEGRDDFLFALEFPEQRLVRATFIQIERR